MKQCRTDCIHAEACRRFADNSTYWNSGDCPIYKPTADVVPKSEYDELKTMLDAAVAGQETLQKALAEAKTEVARRIFEEMEQSTFGDSTVLRGRTRLR